VTYDDPITVVIADDDGLLRRGLTYIIQADQDIVVVGEAADGSSITDVVNRLHPGVVLMDVRMPGLDGIEATLRIKAADSPPRVLILSSFSDDESVVDAFRCGADGYVLKRISPEDLRTAIRIVASGDALVHPGITRDLIDRYVVYQGPKVDLSRLYGLTDREIDVLTELAAGRTNDAIAEHLQVTIHTVKTHLARIFAKTGCTSRVQAAILAFESGLVRSSLRQRRPPLD
jgi:DNA-binding NarL/FixJ family response regulator